MSMFDAVELTDLSDSELDELVASGKGKPAVYRKPINELLDSAGDRQGSVSVPWLTINPAATNRQTVIAGMKGAVKKHDRANGRVFVKANPDDSLITLIVKASA